MARKIIFGAIDETKINENFQDLYDNKIDKGQMFTIKDPCRVATTDNISLSGLQTIDGILLVAGDRILVKNQTAASQNGIYIVALDAWSRSTDADIDVELILMYTFVSSGIINGSTGWVLTTNPPIIMGITSLIFVKFAGTIQGIQGIQGIKGDTGATGIQGIQGIKGANWKGNYNGSTPYLVNDIVEYNGSSYICILNSTGNLPTNITYFQLVAQKGENGTGSILSVSSANTDISVANGTTNPVLTLNAANTGADKILKLDASGKAPVSIINGLGTAATTASSDYATAAQGTKADSALQNAAAFATSAQGVLATNALPSASYTAADILAKIKTVDGVGSLLDADTVDGAGLIGSGIGGLRGITTSTSVPTGGSDGDIWIQYIA